MSRGRGGLRLGVGAGEDCEPVGPGAGAGDEAAVRRSPGGVRDRGASIRQLAQAEDFGAEVNAAAGGFEVGFVGAGDAAEVDDAGRGRVQRREPARVRLDLAQPAQTLMSHSAWKVTRRRPASLVRETRFVEIGPVTGFGRAAAEELLPFPELRFGWGLDLHWAALAGKRGWRLGVVDALPVRHDARTVAAAYPRAEAESEAARFLRDRPYLPSGQAGDVLATHRRAP